MIMGNKKKNRSKLAMHNTKLNKYAMFSLPLYVFITGAWIIIFLKYGEENTVFSWQNYVCTMLLSGVIHVWAYAILKFQQSRDTLNELFIDSKTVYDKILLDYDDVRNLNPLKGSDYVRKTIKFLYLGLWFLISIVIVICAWKLHVYGIGDFKVPIIPRISWMFIFVLLIIGMILNCMSYYANMAFCFFTREIANAQNLSCECINPWNSKDLRQLVKISSRSSISFFIVSMMYMASVTISISTIDKPSDDLMRYLIMLLVLTTFLCAFSFVLFSLIPKLFLNRRFRNWKFEIAPYLNDSDTVSEKRFEEIWNSKLPFVRMETVSGCIAIAIDLGSLVVSIVALVLKS